MAISVSTTTNDAMLNVVGDLLSGGNLEILSDASEPELLCVLGLDPGPSIDGEMEIRVSDGIAGQSGRAAFARALGADGSEVFACDVGEEGSGATIRLNTTKIRADKEISIKSFRLMMP